MADTKFTTPGTRVPGVTASTFSSNAPGNGKAVPFVTDWHMFAGTDIIAALAGSATSVTAKVERSPIDPSKYSAALIATVTSPADATGFTGSLATGIAPNIYTEAGVAWWRISVTAVSGGDCTASLSGKGTPL